MRYSLVSISMSGVYGQGSSNLSHGISASGIESASLEIEFWPCSSGRLDTPGELPFGAYGTFEGRPSDIAKLFCYLFSFV